MAHNPTQRRKLATPASPSISQNTGKRYPKPSATSTSTVYNLTNHFSRLHPNPKPTNSHNPLPQKHIDSPLQLQALSKSANNLESSNPSFGQDIRKPGKRVVFESGKSNSLAGDEKDIESKKEMKKVARESKKGGERNKAMVVKPTIVGDGIGKRRSFSDAQVELANFLATNCAKVVSADMPPFMQIHAVGFARKTKDSLEKFSSKSLALSLKKELDGVYGPAWHCIVGTSFGSFVTHSVGGFLYFSLDQKLYVLLFKTTVQRAD